MDEYTDCGQVSIPDSHSHSNGHIIFFSLLSGRLSDLSSCKGTPSIVFSLEYVAEYTGPKISTFHRVKRDFLSDPASRLKRMKNSKHRGKDVRDGLSPFSMEMQ